MGRAPSTHVRFKAHRVGPGVLDDDGGGGSGDDGDGDGGGEEERIEIGSGCYIQDRRGPSRAGPAAVSNLATFGAAGSRVLARDRVKGIYIHFDPLITRSLGSRFGTRYPSSLVYIYLALSPLPSLAFSFPLSLLASFFSFSIGSASATSS